MKLKEYKTRDLYEAAFIYAQRRYNFIGLEPDGRDFLFVFEEGCKGQAKHYYDRQATVIAKDYADAIGTLKGLIFSRLPRRSL